MTLIQYSIHIKSIACVLYRYELIIAYAPEGVGYSFTNIGLCWKWSRNLGVPSFLKIKFPAGQSAWVPSWLVKSLMIGVFGPVNQKSYRVSTETVSWVLLCVYLERKKNYRGKIVFCCLAAVVLYMYLFQVIPQKSLLHFPLNSCSIIFWSENGQSFSSVTYLGI